MYIIPWNSAKWLTEPCRTPDWYRFGQLEVVDGPNWDCAPGELGMWPLTSPRRPGVKANKKKSPLPGSPSCLCSAAAPSFEPPSPPFRQKVSAPSFFSSFNHKNISKQYTSIHPGHHFPTLLTIPNRQARNEIQKHVLNVGLKRSVKMKDKDTQALPHVHLVPDIFIYHGHSELHSLLGMWLCSLGEIW